MAVCQVQPLFCVMKIARVFVVCFSVVKFRAAAVLPNMVICYVCIFGLD